MFKFVVLLAIVGLGAADPLHPCYPHLPTPCLPPCSAPCDTPCDTPCVEQFESPCEDKVITTCEGPVEEKIITPCPVVEKIITPVIEKVITPCPGPVVNRVIAPVSVPTTICHTYRKEIINEPVLTSYPATVPCLTKTHYSSPYYPYPSCGYPGVYPAPYGAPFTTHFPQIPVPHVGPHHVFPGHRPLHL